MKKMLKIAIVAATVVGCANLYAATAGENYVVSQCPATSHGKLLFNAMDRVENQTHLVECFYGKKGNSNGPTYYGAMAVNPDTHTPLSYHWKIDYQNNDQGNCLANGKVKNC